MHFSILFQTHSNVVIGDVFGQVMYFDQYTSVVHRKMHFVLDAVDNNVVFFVVEVDYHFGSLLVDALDISTIMHMVHLEPYQLIRA